MAREELDKEETKGSSQNPSKETSSAALKKTTKTYEKLQAITDKVEIVERNGEEYVVVRKNAIIVIINNFMKEDATLRNPS